MIKENFVMMEEFALRKLMTINNMYIVLVIITMGIITITENMCTIIFHSRF